MAFLAGCGDPSHSGDEAFEIKLPERFEQFQIPEDNSLTKDRIQLGRKLFYDVNLSRDSSISCGHCHKQEFAFSDTLPISVGISGRQGFRNVPTLGNIAWHPYFFREGGSPTLEMQMLGPIQNHTEMDMTISDVVGRLKKNKKYQNLSRNAYGREMSAFVLSRSLAAFERILITGKSSYDRYINGVDSLSMDSSAIRGMRLFFSEELACSMCHGGPDFTNYAIENNGLYLQYKDEGLKRVTQRDSDSGKFKVPSLRNIGLTAPYMSDGSLKTLQEVLEHYNSGGQPHPNKNPLIEPLNLSDEEKSDLIAFLKSLTDEQFISNPEFARPEN